MPTISYFLATDRHPIDDTHPLWDQVLPESRMGQASAEAREADDHALGYGDYFSAVIRFCSESGWNRILLAAADKLKQSPSVDDISAVSVFLEKHGAFYHPARIDVTVAGQDLSLVVNVATSHLGKAALAHETRSLAYLNEHRPFGWFPVVYASADEDPPMFLGDWFDGFHEFHLTRIRDRTDLGMVMWDGAAAPRLLSGPERESLYGHMAMILAASYDPITTRQIFPWHHAAGDFVVQIQAGKVLVKLITVRNYAPFINESAGPADEEEMLELLLFFLLHLSIRMRLDRLDGVAEVVWAPDSCVAPTVDGFFQGLDLTARLNGFPESFALLFKRFAGARGSTDLLPAARQIVERVFDTSSEERQVIDRHLKAHIEAVVRRLND